MRVRLFRDSFDTPWGFRLQGGKDLQQPLVVQRVFSNTPAEGELQRGDIILSINSRDAAGLTHKQALDNIKFGGGQVELVIDRPAVSHIKPLNPSSPTRAPSNLPPVPQGPIQIPIRRKSDQSSLKFQSSMPPPVTGHTPTKITLNKYGGGSQSFGSSYAVKRTGKAPRPFKPVSSDYTNYGVDYTKVPTQPAPPKTSFNVAPPPPPPQRPVNAAPDEPDTALGPPAWSNTLRSSNIPKPWEKEQQDYYMTQEQQRGPPPVQPKPAVKPPQAPPQRQITVRTSSTVTKTQTQQQPGDRDWNQSYVYRMIHGQSEHRGPTGHAVPQTAPPPPPFKQQQQQQHIPQPAATQMFVNMEEFGTSDF